MYCQAFNTELMLLSNLWSEFKNIAKGENLVMAGAFTHFMICKEASASPDLEDFAELAGLLQSHPTEMYLGSVSPDLPYPAVLEQYTGSRSWADYMHKGKTNGVLINGIEKLRELREKEDSTFNNKVAWLLGYGSHLIVDAVIHPIVETIVGPYSNPKNRKPHFICEQTQDTFIFKEIEGTELIEADFVRNNLGTGFNKELEEVFEFWKELMVKTYFPDLEYPIRQSRKNVAERGRETVRDIAGNRIYRDTIESSIDPSRWNRWYRELLSQAAGGSLHKLSRHFAAVGEYCYKRSAEIPNEYKREYFTEIKLPNGEVGDFQERGFDYAVTQLIEGWKRAYSGVNEGRNISTFYKNWNLDTGKANDSNELTFWRSRIL